jgi:hypothetical protein
MKLQLRAKVEKSQIVWQNPERLSNLLQSLSGKEVFVTIKEFKPNRSLNQNSYYWGIVIEILSDFTGYSRDEMHEVLKTKFLSYKVKILHEEFVITKSTTSLTTQEFEDYLRLIREWASTMGCYIPLPNEIGF